MIELQSLVAPPGPGDTLGRLTAAAPLSESLSRQSVVPARATQLAARIARCADALVARGGALEAPACALVVPGRIEVLGKHTDYGGGRSLLVATEQGFVAVSVPHTRPVVDVVDVGLDRFVSVPLAGHERDEGGWSTYVRAVARWLATHFPDAVRGATIAFENTLPKSAGASSSSALITTVFLGLASVGTWARTDRFDSTLPDRETLAACIGAIEGGQAFGPFGGHAGVGTRGGSQDHTAILCARPGQVVQYAFGPLRFERAVDLPPRTSFVVAFSGVEASKTGTERDAYNAVGDRLRDIERLAHELLASNDAPESMGSVLAAVPGMADRLRKRFQQLPRAQAEPLSARFEQFQAESFELVPAAADALATGDLARFGELVDRSQRLAESALGNQVVETLALQRLAREHGALAASAFGAGFGGSVWALVRESDVDDFTRRWQASYALAYPEHQSVARFFRTGAAQPALRL